MDLGSGIDEDQMSSRGKLSFSYSSSSSPSSSSSFFQICQEKQNQQQQKPYWLGNKYHPVEDSSRLTKGGGAADGKHDVVEVSDDQDVAKGDSSTGVVIEKEHMFDKVVTPSDVGKLNRIVIPKQHAEKYFPLDSSANEKGLLLNFEDRSGKPWRFRYSYWNSSQSYVMTKGWSRFVKEKKLDAGDIVSFQRGVGEIGKDRLYIDWRRCPDAPKAYPHPQHYHHQNHFSSHLLSPLLMRPRAPLLPSDHLHFSNVNRNAFYNVGGGSYAYGFGNYNNVVNSCTSSQSAFYKRSSESTAPTAAPQQVGMGIVQWEVSGCGAVEPMVYESVPVVQGKAAAKKLRLFGVNMDCPIMESSDAHECSDLSSTTTPHASMALQHAQLAAQNRHHPQFRLYKGTPVQRMMPSTQFLKGKSPFSLDLDI